MALKQATPAPLLLLLAVLNTLAQAPFPAGASMAGFGALHGDDLVNTQAWESAVFPIYQKGAGLCISGVRYFDVLDNAGAFSLSHLTGGAWYSCPKFRIKSAGTFLNAYNIYAETEGFVSAACQFNPRFAASAEFSGKLYYLLRQAAAMQSTGAAGFTGLLAFRHALVWLGVKNIPLDNATAPGFSAPLALQAGISSRQNRFGCQGLTLEADTRPNSIRLNVAQHYRFCKEAGVIVALTTNPSMIGAGFTLALPHYGATVGLVHHPLLGWSQGLMLAKNLARL